MIKANAYGHGGAWAAEVLGSQKNVLGFGLATFSEALEIRNHSRTRKPLWVFSDSAPWTSDHLQLCERHNIEPVFSEIESLLRFQAMQGSRKISAHVEVNTGMNRMGVPVESLSLIRFHPKSIFTHLAEAENPNSRLTIGQFSRFSEVVKWSRQKFPKTLIHFANSAAIWNAKSFPLFREMDLVRPGLSLYGVRPYDEAQEAGLRRVMTCKVSVINKIYLEKGDRVGYGGTYHCARKQGEWVATLGGGYGDGIFRALGGSQKSSGIGLYEKSKTKVKFLGRVSMDLCAVSASAKVGLGDSVVLWGDAIDPYEQAAAAGTIPYEIMTRIGFNSNTRIEWIK